MNAGTAFEAKRWTADALADRPGRPPTEARDALQLSLRRDQPNKDLPAHSAEPFVFGD
jgi:hypothetical protein